MNYQKKEEDMRKTVAFAFSMLALSMVVSIPLFAATEGDLIGTWNTYNVSKMKISRIGSRTANNDTTTTLTDAAFTMHEIDSTGTYNYTGNWVLIKDGKKIQFSLDAPGQSVLVSMWENWLVEVAKEYGASIVDISFSVTSLTISQPGIPKRTNIPKKATIKAKGLVSATVDGEPMTRKFSYSSKVSFLNRQ
jgi:hypothetical protein